MKTPFALFAAIALLAFASCNQPAATTEQVTIPPSEQYKQTYQEVVKAFETGNTDSLGNYVAENSIDHSAPIPEITTTGLQRLKDIIALYRASFPDMKMSFHHVVVEGDKLMAHGSWSGTNTGEFMGMPPTNKAVSNVEFIDIIRFENGKMAEHWELGDQISMFTQLGLMPPMDTTMPSVSNPTFDWNAPVSSDSAQLVRMKDVYNNVVAMLQSGDLTNIGNYLTENFTEHMLIPGVQFPAGIEGAKQAMAMFKQAYPDLKMTVEHVAAEGDVLMAYVWVEGTLAPGFPGLPPTAAGKKVKFATVDIVKFSGDKGVEHWEVGDHYTELVQLGIIPDPSAQPAAAN